MNTWRFLGGPADGETIELAEGIEQISIGPGQERILRLVGSNAANQTATYLKGTLIIDGQTQQVFVCSTTLAINNSTIN